ncbi:MAG: PKD domain-containing protein [Patescibacteria group bacterium]|nr:hypothetical protein [Patescibacteria group bacterium]MBU1870624.1 hypothetical protein [Patescibacteria group bacterium]
MTNFKKSVSIFLTLMFFILYGVFICGNISNAQTDVEPSIKVISPKVISPNNSEILIKDSVSINQPPVIFDVSGPTILKVNEAGIWTIKANDPENGQLTYSVVWGDEDVSSGGAQLMPKYFDNTQTTTFTHSYRKAGNYTPTFTVTDNQGLSAKTSISINVENGNCQSICKEINTRSEGWYDSCTGNLIRWEKCSGSGTETCIKENESLGAVIPDNNKKCCEGLKPYIPSDSAGIKIIGTRGICKKISDQQIMQIDPQITQINNSAGRLHGNELNEILKELKQLRNKIKEQESEIKYLRNLTKGIKGLVQSAKDAINNFITYGVDDNTQKLGAGERAAVISSYKSAFGKLPETESELSDAIKIANGRFPSITNDKAEKKAKNQFIKIYKRIADINNANDSAAIKVMAYGLKQKAENRNLNSEKSGIKTFDAIYGRAPKSTEDWNTMQAITYSGAKKMIDTDKDLLSDEMEKKLGTNPNKADSDNDGHKDGMEVNNGYDPLKK